MYREKYSVMLLLLCLLATPVIAETRLIDEYFFDKDTFAVDAKVYTLHWDIDGQMRLTTDQEFLAIDKSTCIIHNVTKLCYNESVFDSSRNAMKARMRVFSFKPEITIYRSISDTALLLDQEATITTFINNTGDSQVHHYEFTDEFPEEINITSVTFCNRDGNTIYWSGSLDSGYGTECQYKITPSALFSITQKARATYYNGVELVDVFSDPVTLTGESFVTHTISTQKNTILLGATTNLTINVTSTHEKRTNISYIITLPSSLLINKLPAGVSKGTNNKYYWSTAVYENATAQVIIPIIGSRIGRSEANIQATVNNVLASYELPDKKQEYVVEGVSPILRTQLDPSDKLESDHEYGMKVLLNNPNQHLACLKNRVGFETDLLSLKNYTLSHVNQSGNKYVVNTKFTAPSVSTQKIFPFKVTVNCTTDFGDTYYTTLTKNYRVQPIQDLVITPKASKSSEESSREITMEVKVKNPRQTPVRNVQVTDHLPSWLRENGIVRGVTSSSVDILEDTEVKVYTYTLTLPSVKEKKQVIINTTTSYIDNVTGKKVSGHKETVLTILPKKIKLGYTRSVVDTSVHRNTFVGVTHILKNNDVEPMHDITVIFPQVQNATHKGKRSYAVKSLNPGESVTSEQIEQVLFSTNRVDLPPVEIKYKDKNGLTFNTTEVPLTITTIGGYAEHTAPLIEVRKKASLVGGAIVVEIETKNLGDITAHNIQLVDDMFNTTIPVLGVDGVRSHTYTRDALEFPTGEQTLSAITVQFKDGAGTQYFTASNKPTIILSERDVIVVAERKVERQDESVVVEDIVEETPSATVEKEKGFIEKLLNAVQKLFSTLSSLFGGN